QSVSGQGIFTGGIVADGSVTLNVWSVEDVDDYTFNLRDFNTSGEFLIGMTIVFSGRTSLGEGEMDAVADYVEGYGPAPDWLEAVGIGGTVTFTNGVGSLTGGPPFWW
ncbi:MAG: hypothetical protein FWC64_02200, partial [Treponema sp.]|nr:hypothetical protein [Treponema sp.]